jgi:uncharacterized protein (DUF58 family)
VRALRRFHHYCTVGLWSRGLDLSRTVRLQVGWPLLLLPFVLFGQLVTPHPVWLALLISLVGLYVGAFLWVRAAIAGVALTRRRQGSVLVAGDSLREDFDLVNQANLQVLWAAFVDHSDLPGYAPGSVVAAPPKGAYRWWSEVACQQRGAFRLGPYALELGDPFGLFAAEIRYARTESVLIYPRVVQLPTVELPRGSAGGSTPRRRPLLGVLPAASVRDYAIGDSMRHIHWPSTARRGQFMVKEMEQEPSGDIWIVLDLQRGVQQGAGAAGTLEYSIILAASMAAEMVSGRARRAAGLLTASGDAVIVLPPQPGQAQLWAIMAALAPAQATEWSLAALLRRNRTTLGRRHTLVVITAAGVNQDDWVAELVQAGAQELASTVLMVSQPDNEARCAPTVAMLHRLAVPVQVLRTDYVLPTALTYRRRRRVIRTTPTGGAFTVEIEEEVG